MRKSRATYPEALRRRVPPARSAGGGSPNRVHMDDGKAFFAWFSARDAHACRPCLIEFNGWPLLRLHAQGSPRRNNLTPWNCVSLCGCRVCRARTAASRLAVPCRPMPTRPRHGAPSLRQRFARPLPAAASRGLSWRAGGKAVRLRPFQSDLLRCGGNVGRQAARLRCARSRLASWWRRPIRSTASFA